MREPRSHPGSPHYERPNQAWACGLASNGEACPAGPSARGRCPALAECKPLRDGDRWQCNRSPLRGGPCDAGPTPQGACPRVQVCQPVRSLRAVRTRFVFAVALLAIGGMFVLLSMDRRNEIIAPGPLAQSHAQLFSRDGGNSKCSACHAAADDGALEWAVRLVNLHDAGPTQSQLCLECHGEFLSPSLALVAHNVPPDLLGELSPARMGTSSSGLANVIQSTLSPGERVACSTCHREHHGPHADLTAIDNSACQACHEQRYESFAADHPDFGIWPYERRTRIAFNHASHRAKHFAEKKQAFDCRNCHVEDSTRSVQLTVSYEVACASCHYEKIATSVSSGVPMIALPMLDVEALREAGHDISPWPEVANGDFDGRLPTVMTMLLAGDAAAVDALATLGGDFDFFDVRPEDPQQLAACAELAGAVKRLIRDLGKSEIETVRARLTAALGGNVTPAEAASLVAGLSTDTLQGAAAWISANSPAPGTSTPSKHGGTLPAPTLATSFAPGGSWFRDDATLSIRYRPAAHADPVLASWLGLVTRADPSNRLFERDVLRKLADPQAPGLCVSCHSMEQSAGRALTVNWRSHARPPASRTFTKFSHGPHLVLPQLADCTTCHAIAERAQDKAAYVGTDPCRFVSDFAPMTKKLCAACHTATAAGDRCQTCHNYHVESPAAELGMAIGLLGGTTAR